MAHLTVCCDHLLLEALAAGASQFGLNKKRVTFTDNLGPASLPVFERIRVNLASQQLTLVFMFLS